jgi:hypothetical protein
LPLRSTADLPRAAAFFGATGFFATTFFATTFFAAVFLTAAFLAGRLGAAASTGFTGATFFLAGL